MKNINSAETTQVQRIELLSSILYEVDPLSIAYSEDEYDAFADIALAEHSDKDLTTALNIAISELITPHHKLSEEQAKQINEKFYKVSQ